MAALLRPLNLRALHPMHAILLAFTFPLFLGALLSDIAYAQTYQIQWSNFSSWLIAGGLLGSGFAILWALVDLFRFRWGPDRRPLIYIVVLIVTWLLGFLSGLVHAKDAWGTMPEGLYLSAISALLALIATWIGFAGFTRRELN